MNGSRQMAEALIGDVLAHYKVDAKTQVLLFPPAVYLAQTAQLLEGSAVHFGAQTVSEHTSGAYTGEISADMLQDMGCQSVLVGHSERRSLYKESNEDVAAKFMAAKQQGLVPVLCVGESLEQREQKITLDVVLGQIAAIIEENGVNVLENAVIAYEPVWAIGTGLTALPEQAQQVHQAIRQYVADLNEEIAKNLPILYGGSVKPDNAKQLFAMADIDGGLIGGASLKSADFLAIIEQAQQVEK